MRILNLWELTVTFSMCEPNTTSLVYKYKIAAQTMEEAIDALREEAINKGVQLSQNVFNAEVTKVEHVFVQEGKLIDSIRIVDKRGNLMTNTTAVDMKKSPQLRKVDQINAFEDKLSVYSPDQVKDLLAPLILPFPYKVLIDAEMEVIGLIHAEKAIVLIELLNWACEHYPYVEPPSKV